MRKILFWILIAIFLFLVVVLGVAFYQDKTPLRVLQSRFGITDTVVVQEVITGDAAGDVVTSDVLLVTGSTSENTGNVTSGNIIVDGTSLSEEDKKSTENLLNGLLIK